VEKEIVWKILLVYNLWYTLSMKILSKDRKRVLLDQDEINLEYGAVAKRSNRTVRAGDVYVTRGTMVWKRCEFCGNESQVSYRTYQVILNSKCRSCSMIGKKGNRANTGKRWSQERKNTWSSRLVNMYQNGIYARKSTKPEKEFKSILDINNIEYVFQYALGAKSFDFCLPKHKILIEIDGTYWHSRNYTFESMNATQLGNYANDITKGIIANKYGFRLLRIWEDELSEGFKILLTLLEDNGRQDL
jgi:very-short-patch-repair endonuclease